MDIKTIGHICFFEVLLVLFTGPQIHLTLKLRKNKSKFEGKFEVFKPSDGLPFVKFSSQNQSDRFEMFFHIRFM